MTQSQSFEAIVIGAGPGGYVAAIRLAQLGVKTAVVERRYLGGVCLNVGCIPSKALIEASKRFSFVQNQASEMGIEVKEATVDFATTQKWKEGIVNKLTSGVGALLKSHGVTLFQGDARFDGPGRLRVKLAEGGETHLESPAIVIASGSRPIEIDGFPFDSDHVVSSTGALALSKIPKRMVVIGGGYIGLEMGGVYARLGSKVTIVEMADQILPGFAKDLIQPVAKQLRKSGADILLQSRATGFTRSRGVSKVTIEGTDGTSSEITTDVILVTVGRRPNTESLGLENIGLEPSKGFIAVDRKLRTKVPGVFAIGDVAGEPMLAHKASKEGEVVAEVIAGHNAEVDVQAIPAVVFTDPEIATVGLSEEQARTQGYTPAVGKFPFAANGRALTTGKADGFVRVISDKESDIILGTEIVGPGASDLIAEAGLAVEMAAQTVDIGLTVHAHPTLAEAMMEASNAVRGEAIHAVQKKSV
jgi:dihydrolipoamide dehydrogenase